MGRGVLSVLTVNCRPGFRPNRSSVRAPVRLACRGRHGIPVAPRSSNDGICHVERVPPNDPLADRPRASGSWETLSMTNVPIDLAEKLSSFSEHWSPKLIARLNDHETKREGQGRVRVAHP